MASNKYDFWAISGDLGCVDILPRRLLNRLLYKAFRANLRFRVTL